MAKNNSPLHTDGVSYPLEASHTCPSHMPELPRFSPSLWFLHGFQPWGLDLEEMPLLMENVMETKQELAILLA